MLKKKFKSTVLCCAFHPSNGQLLATGCADFKMRIFSTFTTEVDGSNVDPGPFRSTHGPLEFGETYVELSTSSWVEAVAWSPSGNVVAYSSHDSMLHFATLGQSAEPTVQMLRLTGLPLCALLFLSDTAIVGVGHDLNPFIFNLSRTSNQWSLYCTLEKDSVLPLSASAAGAPLQSENSVSKARELFKSKTIRGQDFKAESDALKTTHERLINCLNDATTVRGKGVSVISTSGLDGKLVTWSLPQLDIAFSSLAI